MSLNMGSTARAYNGASDIRSSGFAAYPHEDIPTLITLTEAAYRLSIDRRFAVDWLKRRKVVIVDYLFEDEPQFLRVEIFACIHSLYQKSAQPEMHRSATPHSRLESVGCDNKVLNNATVGLSSAHYDVREQNPAPAGSANIDATAGTKVGRLEQAAPAARKADVSPAEPLVKVDAMVQAAPLNKPAPVTQAASMIQGEPEVQPANKAQAATKLQTELFAAPAPLKQPASSIQGEDTATPAPLVKVDAEAQVTPTVQPSPATQAATAIQGEVTATPAPPVKADADVQVTPIVQASPAVNTASVDQPAPFDQNEPVTQTASKALSEPEIQHVVEVAAKGKDVSVTQNDPDAQTAAVVTAETTVDHLASAEQFKLFLKSLPKEGTHSVSGYKYIEVRVNQKSTVIEIRVKVNKKTCKKKLFKHLHHRELELHNLVTVIERYRSFLEQYKAGRLFHQINFQPYAIKTRLNTMRELIAFYIENNSWTAENSSYQAKRMFRKYIDCKSGDVDMRTATDSELKAMFLIPAENSDAPSDRDRLLTAIKAAYNLAANDVRVEKLDYPLPLESEKRNRGAAKHVPKLSTYIQFLTKAIELNFYDLASCLLFQEIIYTRLGNTLSLRSNEISFRDCSIRVKNYRHKNGREGFYYFMPSVIPFIETLIENRKRTSGLANPFIFPALTTSKKHKANFGKEMKLVRDALKEEVRKDEASNGFSEQILEIDRFTFHRLRGLNSKLLSKNNVKEGEIEKAFNRYVDDEHLAYCDLSDTYQREFKTTKLQHIANLHPEYIAAIDRLIDHYRSK